MRKITFEKLETREVFDADFHSFPIPILDLPDIKTAEPPAISATVPFFSSNPNATAKLFLDFDGNVESTWGSWSNVTTPAFDVDGNPNAFNLTEINIIDEIFRRVAEDYSIFNIDVTTIDPGNRTNKITASVAIGGSSYDWYGNGAGGVAYVGGFYNSAPNVGFAFASNLQNNSKYIAEAVSHEAGHLFGLQHQSRYDANGVKLESYNSGGNGWAPIMGVGYYQNRTTWHNGTTSSPTTFQDDISIISNSNNGFGLKNDDFVSVRQLNDSSVNINGVITPNDSDVFSFAHGGGTVSFSANVENGITNLTPIVEIRDESDNIIMSSSSNVNIFLPEGFYTVTVKSTGEYGNVGQYNLVGSFNATNLTTPEITVLNGNLSVTTGEEIDYGSYVEGSAVSKSFVVVNDGNSTLNINSVSINGDFTLNNTNAFVLEPGQSTTLVVNMNTALVGEKVGSLVISSNDASESDFIINFTGTVIAKPALNNYTNDNFTTRGTWLYNTLGYDNDSAIANVVNNNAKWTFTNVVNGTYDVYATWTIPSNYTISNRVSYNVNGRFFNNINQRNQRVDLVEEGFNWTKLGTVTVTNGTVTVTLTNSVRNDYMIADAIKLKEK